jgi:hypothetical protein
MESSHSRKTNHPDVSVPVGVQTNALVIICKKEILLNPEKLDEGDVRERFVHLHPGDLFQDLRIHREPV